jgi:hypothetical protein
MTTSETTPPGKPEAPPLREPTSVRFDASLAAAAKRAASRDGAASVSEWVRQMVEQEIRRRDGRCPHCGAKRTAT